MGWDFNGNLMKYGMLMGFPWDFHGNLLTGAFNAGNEAMIHNHNNPIPPDSLLSTSKFI